MPYHHTLYAYRPIDVLSSLTDSPITNQTLTPKSQSRTLAITGTWAWNLERASVARNDAGGRSTENLTGFMASSSYSPDPTRYTLNANWGYGQLIL